MPKMDTTWKTQTRQAQNNMVEKFDCWAERDGSDLGRGPTRSPGQSQIANTPQGTKRTN